MSFILSGFATRKDYDARNVTWDVDAEFADESSAVIEAGKWLTAQRADAQVEIIRLTGNTGQVVAVMTHNGIERIA